MNSMCLWKTEYFNPALILLCFIFQVHVNLLLIEARMQAELLYALRAITRYMTWCLSSINDDGMISKYSLHGEGTKPQDQW